MGDENSEEDLFDHYGVQCECGSGKNCLSQFSRDQIERHIMNVQEMDKNEKEMCVMASLRKFENENTRSGKRKRVRYRYSYENKNVCRRVFRHVYDVGNHTLKGLIKHINENGITPRVHGNYGKRPHNALVFVDVKYAVEFLENYAVLQGIPMPAAPRGRDGEPPIFLPSSLTKKKVHREYVSASETSDHRSLGLTSFKNTWKQCVPHIKIASPRDDVCAKCEKIRGQVIGAVTEEEKLDATTLLQTHIQVQCWPVTLRT
jgi:hypothetical protein